jgi:PAS domain S-box-containing protein
MVPELVTTGISVMGDIPWGTHFCYFYETKQDLLDTSVPYFQAGLENQEFCLWIIYTPITEADALQALRQSTPYADRYLAEGAMEIRVHTESVFDGDVLEPHSSVHYLDQKLDEALARGYAGMRVAGSPSCLQKADRGYFREFEAELGRSVANRRMIALCHFPLADSSAAEIFDAAQTHQFVLARRQGDWEVIETPEIKLAKAEIARRNEQLERRVEERTRALEAANEELRQEIARREQIEEDLRQQKEILETIFNHVPVSIGFLDKLGRIQMVNGEWERLIGHTFDEIVTQGLDVIDEGYPDPVDRKRARDFVASSTSEWADFASRTRDGHILHSTWAVVRLSDGSRIGIGQDITERKRVEQEFRKQKELLQFIFDHIPVMINFVDEDNELQLVNRAWEQTLGWSLEDIRRDKLDILVANYPDPQYRQHVRKFVTESNGQWVDFKTTVRDGHVIDTSWVMLHLPNYRIAGIANDITERKLAEEALRESEERFRQLAENIHDLFWIKTPDLKRVLYLSPVYKRLSGRSPEEVYGDQNYHRFLERIVPEDRERMAEIIRRGAEDEFDVEYRLMLADGSVRWIHDRGFPIRDQSGQIYRMAGIARDITERKLAEEALRESEERFRQIAENIREIFWLTTPDLSQLLYLSPTYQKLMGEPLERWYANFGNESWFEIVHPDDRPTVSEILKTPGQEFDIEFRICRPDGSTRWIRGRGFPIRDEFGVVRRMGGVAEDITDRREAEDRLKASSEQLRALSASLQSAREEEATRIAHQIHDDLGGILTSLRWELEELEKMIQQPAGQDQLEAMRDKLRTMVDLTDTTINVVRRIASELRPSILDDLGLLEAIEWQTQQFQARTGIACRCDCSLQALPLGRLQSTAVFRIFQEALTNILRHARATRVGVLAKVDDGIFVFTVTDNGRGITPAEKLSRKSLGLLGMQERAHLIGGQVDVAGSPGVGTTLRVSVPLELGAHS